MPWPAWPRLLIAQGEPDAALELLARVPETPEVRALAAEARLAGQQVAVGDDVDGPARRAARPGPRRRPGPPGVRRRPRDPRPRRPADRRLPQGARRPAVLVHLDLGGRSYDLTHRALVMGILNRTPDSFYDRGATYGFDAFLRRAEQLVAEGADILDVGGVKAGPGPEVTEAEELDRVVPAIDALARRFDVPISVDTWRASVARAAYDVGAVVGNDISGFADPDYLLEAAKADAAVVATHIRLAPRVRDPDPQYDDVVAAVAEFLSRPGRPGRRRRHPAPTGSSSTPGSTSARRPSSPSSCCAPPACSPASATRCSSRRRTRRSSACSSTSSSPTAGRPRCPPPPSA